jgi:hypothetical protein
MSDTTETTSVETVDLNMDELLGTGADTVMTPDEAPQEEKKNLFSPISQDLSFLDTPGKEDTTTASKKEEIDKEEAEKTTVTRKEVDSALSQPTEEDSIEAEEEKNKGGRPASIVSATKNLIDKGMLLPFDEDKKLDEYTAADFEELIVANMEQVQNNLTKSLPEEFFGNMPEEMKQAYNYIANGGNDLKGLFNALAHSNEVRELDISNEEHQKHAIRSYLQATNYGTPEEIEDEVYSLEDRGELHKKAKQFKPKLDAMQQNIVNQRLAEQDNQAKLRAEQSQKYIDSVYTALEPGDLEGLKIDNRTQNMLYSGLVQSNYPSINGKQTNLLGHLLEKYQWVEPNHGLIAEALWLLADPGGYKEGVRGIAKKEEHTKTLRTLKTEQSSKGAMNQTPAAQESKGRMPAKRSAVARPKRNFFDRQ